ncbi:DDE-type integrase/transposase/recombinase [Mycolicibacterium fortuitum]
MTLWQMDLIRGPALADGTKTTCLVGIDCASRTCTSAQWMVGEGQEGLCSALRSAIATHGAPDQIMTSHASMFADQNSPTLHQTPFNAVCIEHGIDHRLTYCRRPTDMREVERLEKRMMDEFFCSTVAFTDIRIAQQAMDSWVATYNGNPSVGI